MNLVWQLLLASLLSLLAAASANHGRAAFVFPTLGSDTSSRQTATTRPSSISTFVPPASSRANSATALLMTEEETVAPNNFREAEVLGLKLMQDGNYEKALEVFQKALKLPGSRQDVVRTKLLSGPSPVGGSTGGYESQNVLTLDEFELQAAHYNMACAHAQLGNTNEAIASLRTAFENGFDNYQTVRSDPDFDSVRREKEFEKLMAEFEPKKGFNPFGFFGGN